MIVLNFLFAFMFVATEAKINNISKKSGFMHHHNLSHHARHLEDYDPGICADLYDATTLCVGTTADEVDIDACLSCLGAGQTDPENPTCRQLDCQALEVCITDSCNEIVFRRGQWLRTAF